jgi:hypothetical protein
MDEKLFAELVESVKEGGAIMRGEMEPSREWYFETPNAADNHSNSQPLQKSNEPKLTSSES